MNKFRNIKFAAYILEGLAAVALCTAAGRTVTAPRPPSHNAPSSPSTGGAPPDATSATLTGTVRLDGTPPHAVKINMSAEPICAKAHPEGVVPQDVVTGENNAFANVVVYISKGLEGKTFEAPTQSAHIEQKGCLYEPHVLAIQATQKLEVLNADSTTHNIHPIPQNNREWNRSQPPGSAPLEESFGREEISIPVKCNIHPWMKSYIAVFKHPYFAVTDKSGSFTLQGLPPGEYTVQAWQEKYGTVTQTITVGAHETKNVNFVFKAPIGG
jgi:plastocyanin